MKKTVLLLSFALICSISIGFAQQKTIVVTAIGNLEEGVREILENQLQDALLKSDYFYVAERNEAFLAAMNKERLYQTSGLVDEKTIVALAKEIGADFVCIAKVATAFGEQYVYAKLNDLGRNLTVNNSNTKSTLNSMDELLRVSQVLATELSAGLDAKSINQTKKQQLVETQAKAEAAAKEKAARDKAEYETKTEFDRRENRAKSAGYVITRRGLAIQTSDVSTKAIDFTQAETACRTLRLGGKSGWRVPTMDELSTIKSIAALNSQINWGRMNYWSNDVCDRKKHKLLDVDAYEQCAKDGADWYGDYRKTNNCRCVRTVENNERYDPDARTAYHKQLLMNYFEE